MRFALWIALRSLFSKRSRYAHSAIGWITVLGLTLVVAAQCVALSILGGFEQAFTHAILGFNAHLVAMREGEIDPSEPLLDKLKVVAGPGAITGATPFLYREGLMAHHSKVKGVVFKGIDPLTFPRVYDVKVRLFQDLAGKTSLSEVLKPEGGEPPLLLGGDLAEALGVTAEDRTVSVLSPQGDLKKIADVNNFKRFQVVGTFESGLYEYDSQFAFLSLPEAQSFFKVPGKITGWEMRLADYGQAKSLARRMEKALGVPFQVISWDELNAEIFYALRLEKKLFFIIMGLIVLVAAANLVGLVVILVSEQAREVSIFRAMGMKAKTLKKVFTLQGMLLALAGAVLGTALGWMLSSFLATHALFKLAKEVYLVSTLPIDLSVWNMAGVFMFCLIVSYGDTQIAARRLMKMKLDL